jgi:hypothetical protein
VQRAVLLNVSRGVKLSAVVGARYMDELIIWTEQETERASIRDQALLLHLSHCFHRCPPLLILLTAFHTID